MKMRGMQALLGVGLITFAWVANAQTPTESRDESATGERLRRAPAGPRSGPGPQQPSFDAHAWKEALGQADLDRRQASYDQLLDLARRDPAARAALDEWARGQDELAWTSRLALRELERGPSASPFGRSFGGDGLDSLLQDPFGASGLDHRQLFAEIEKRLDELFGRLPSTGALGALPDAQAPGASSQRESFQLESTPDGVKVRVEELKDGQTETREYEAKDMQELLELYPELRDRIQTDPFGGRDFRADLDSLRQRLQKLQQPTPQGVPTDVLGVYVSSSGEESGIRVDRIEPGTIAQAIGIQRGDVLLEINGTELFSAADVSRALEERQPDQQLAVKLRDRQGSERTLTWQPSAANPAK
jgi:hypothetical protein